jgi:UDP-N-acetylglucosamine diphosphorylase/glucosamine-1-phosphate N-acetyltransferase
MNVVLFDDRNREHLLPLAFTRPVCEIRTGILTIREKWERSLESPVSFYTQAYLREKYPLTLGASNIFINGSILPDDSLLQAVLALKEGAYLLQNDCLLAARLSEQQARVFDENRIIQEMAAVPYTGEIKAVRQLHDIFSLNGEAIKQDFRLLTAGRTSEPVPEGTRVLNPSAVFIEKGAKLTFCTLNASDGPVYIGKDAEVMEGALIRGPFALGEHSIIKMGAKIYDSTTIGPHSKVGGEVNNSVIFGFSNKAHDGFLGNAVIGEWCNIGADSNNSNLKNNYAEVRLWNYQTGNFRKTGLQFCGLVMADHAKCGINTMFNTGTVVGVGSNIFGSGFPRNFIPDFSWGGAAGFETYQLAKALEVAERVYERRKLQFTETDRKILAAVFEQTEPYRKF